jgi:acyl-CoA thioester hydrolase
MSEPFTIRFPVRFRDVDVLGHVNNAVYFTYMESARTEYWEHLFGMSSLSQGLSFIVAHAECDFKVPALFGHQIAVTVHTSEIRNSSFDWEYEIKNAVTRELFAKGKTIQVFYDYKNKKSMVVPPDVRKKLMQQ